MGVAFPSMVMAKFVSVAVKKEGPPNQFGFGSPSQEV
jgi:hypothetical protein